MSMRIARPVTDPPTGTYLVKSPSAMDPVIAALATAFGTTGVLPHDILKILARLDDMPEQLRN